MTRCELHQEMHLGFGGCRAPEAPINIIMPTIFSDPEVIRLARPAHVSGSLGGIFSPASTVGLVN